MVDTTTPSSEPEKNNTPRRTSVMSKVRSGSIQSAADYTDNKRGKSSRDLIGMENSEVGSHINSSRKGSNASNSNLSVLSCKAFDNVDQGLADVLALPLSKSFDETMVRRGTLVDQLPVKREELNKMGRRTSVC